MDRMSLTPSRLVVIQDKPPGEMTLRELRDTVTNIMLLWSKDIHATTNSTDGLLSFMDACFHRLGELAWATWPCGYRGSPISDDVGSIEMVRVGGGDHEQVSLSCLRSMVCSFMVAYRLIHWMRVSATEQEGVDGIPQASPIHQHHINASLDEFYRMAMFYDLPPASRLNYRHMFSGLYNCISQPVYYHNPGYERRVQLPLHAVQVRRCGAPIQTNGSVLGCSDTPPCSRASRTYAHSRRCSRSTPRCRSCTTTTAWRRTSRSRFRSSHPTRGGRPYLSSHMRYRGPHLTVPPPKKNRYAFRWLITSGRVYLFRWDPKDRSHAVYREKDGNIITCLRRHYLPHRCSAPPASVVGLRAL